MWGFVAAAGDRHILLVVCRLPCANGSRQTAGHGRVPLTACRRQTAEKPQNAAWPRAVCRGAVWYAIPHTPLPSSRAGSRVKSAEGFIVRAAIVRAAIVRAAVGVPSRVKATADEVPENYRV